MERRESVQPPGAPQPIPLVQMLPDGRLAYVSLPMAPVSNAQPQPFAQAAELIDARISRDRWGCVVKVSSIFLLALSAIGLACRLCFVLENKHSYQWALWTGGLVVDVFGVLAGVLGVRAGCSKTASSARSYLRFLVFFAVVYVLACAVGSLVAVKLEMKWVDRHGDRQPDYYRQVNPVEEGTALLQESQVVGSDGPVTPEEEGSLLEEEDWMTAGRHGEPGQRRRRHWKDDIWNRRNDRDERRRRRDHDERRRHDDPDEEPFDEDERPWRRHDRDEKRDGDDRPPHREDRDERRHRDDRDERRHDNDERRPRRDEHEGRKERHEREERRPHRNDHREEEREDRSHRREGDDRRPHRGDWRDERGHEERREGEDSRPPRPPRFDNRHQPSVFPSGMPRDAPFIPGGSRPCVLPAEASSDDSFWNDWIAQGVTEFPELEPADKKRLEEMLQEQPSEQYGHRDEQWTREQIEDFLLLGAVAGVVMTIAVCSCCVFCACRLVTHSQRCEALYPSFPQQYSYVQMAQPPVVQAVPLARPAAYPNLAPMGSAVAYQR